jgi:nitronate monooxygenase
VGSITDVRTDAEGGKKPGRYFSTVHGKYLRPSVVNAECDPDNLPSRDKGHDELRRRQGQAEGMYDIRSAGQGTGAVTQIEPVADVIVGMRCEFREAWEEFCRTPAK